MFELYGCYKFHKTGCIKKCVMCKCDYMNKTLIYCYLNYYYYYYYAFIKASCSEELTRHLLQNKVDIKMSNYAAAKNITKQFHIHNIKQNHVSGSRKQESHKGDL